MTEPTSLSVIAFVTALIGFVRGGLAMVNVGVELPLNDRDRYDWRAYVYFIWDFADGGLLEGW